MSGRRSWRWLRVFLQHLPAESHTMTALRNKLSDQELAKQAEQGDPEKGRWSQSEQLLASAVDALRRVEYVLICANTNSKAKRPKPPEPTRRPGAKAAKSRSRISDTQAATIFQLINGGAA